MSKPILIKIDGKWVNVSSWCKVHPGGADPILRYCNKDSTDAFFSLHSAEAIAMFSKMKPVAPPPDFKEDEYSKLSAKFQTFRKELKTEGWFDRNWFVEMLYLGIMLSLLVVGSLISYDYPVMAMILIGLGMEQAGWTAHDFLHGRGTACGYLGIMGGLLINGFSANWWSAKHNTHHVHPNQKDVDDDIANDPILHLWIPKTESEDFILRKFQHFYYHIVYTLLYASWRLQSIMYIYDKRNYKELALVLLNYLWLYTLPFKVAVGSILVGGWLVAEIVTATHQSEEIMDSISYKFVSDQFQTTRDVRLDNMFASWLWGGMNYQLEHHLFPTMPRYYYYSLTPKVKQFAEENKLNYRTSSAIEILKLNYDTMKRYALGLPNARSMKAKGA